MNTLDRICADKQVHISAMKAKMPLAALEEKIEQQPPCRGFINRISSCAATGRPALIAEVKKASPSKGVIREDFDPVEIARIYERAGATCLSVLTDTPYFQGRDEYLTAVHEAVTLPVLRKDFMLDPYQIYESRALGADCVLLIMAALSDSQAQELDDLARSLGMDVLIEVHDDKELKRARLLRPAMVGINNRNLGTLEVDTNTARRLVPYIPAGAIKVAESGIYTHAELADLQACGYQAFLVGESLMREADIETAVKKLLGSA